MVRATRKASCRNQSTLALAVASCFAAGAHANPTGPTVTAGNATFQTLGNTLSITNVPGTIIQWQGFSIQANEITRFLQQNSNSAVLNRVTGGNMSQLLGQLLSNGRVFLINPSGIVVGQGAVIDVAALVASSLNLSDKDFLAGRYRFTGQEGAGRIVNQGTISTPSGGFVYLVAPNVENHGIIRSPNGEVILAAGKTVELVSAQSPQLRVEIDAPEGEAVNLGEIISQAGRVGIYGASIRNSGRVSANSAVVGENGKIVFKATKDVTLADGSRVEATNSAGKGGSVEVQGDMVALTGDASIDVSGRMGGGSVLVGGDYHGANPDVQNASGTFLGAGTSIHADALESGDGGRVIVWSNEATRVHGSISAQGAGGGKGGFVETSSKGYLEVTNAPNLGAGGTWLLDPYNIEVVADGTGNSNNDGAPTFTPNGDDSKIQAGQISGQLTSGVNVVLDTGGTGSPGTQAGNIDVNAGISSTGSGSLTLNAASNVSVNASIATGAGAFNTTAGGDMTVRSNVTSTGMNLNVAGVLSVDGGATQDAKLISNGGGQSITAQTVNVTAQNNHASTIENRGSGNQTITATTGGMNLQALGGSGVAQIINSAPGASQTLSMAGLLNVLGGTTTVPGLRNSGVFQNTSGLQHITSTGILLQASSTGSGANTSAAFVTSAPGGADQLIDITGGGGSITLNAANGGSGNGASIASGRNQTITGNADFFLNSAAGGNASITAPSAGLTLQQTISAHDITLANGTGGINGNVTIVGGKQAITATGNVTLNAQAGIVTPGSLAGIRIGSNGGASDVTMTIGGNLTLNGGSAQDNAASIGSSGAGTATDNKITITTGTVTGAGSVILNGGTAPGAVARIGTGTLQPAAAGDISITAVGGSIQLNGGSQAAAIRTTGNVTLTSGATISEDAQGFIEAAKLTLNSRGSATLGGNNKVGTLSAPSVQADPPAPLGVLRPGVLGSLTFNNTTDLNVVDTVSSAGMMTVTVNGALNVNGNGAQNALLISNGGQNITARSVNVTAQNNRQSGFQNNGGASQTITATAGGISLKALGGSGVAQIVNNAPGASQVINMTGLLDVLGGTTGTAIRGSGVFQQASTGTQSVTANGITLQASGTGTASSTSNAIILSQSGDQFVDAGGGDINMFGASAGTGNNALISALGNQQVRAHDINLENGTGGFNSVAAILGAHQTVTATGDVTLTGKSSSATGGQVSGVRIGGNGGATDLHLHADGSITLQGGTTDNNGVGIGSSAVGTAFDNTIDVSAGGNIVLNSGSAPSTGSRIGAGPNGNAHGSLKVTAGGEIQLNGTAQSTAIRTLDDVQISASKISEASNGFIVASTLSLSTSGSADLGGPNQVLNLTTPVSGPAGVGSFLTFHNTQGLNILDTVSSAGAMNLSVDGMLTLAAGAGHDAILSAQGGQTLSAQALSVSAQDGRTASITNSSFGDQTLTIAGGGTGAGVDVRTFAGGGTASIINNTTGAQTLAITDADHIAIVAGPGAALPGGAFVRNQAGMQTVSITGTGANAIRIGDATSGDASDLRAAQQSVTAGTGTQAGSITIVGPNRFQALAGIVDNPFSDATQTISTSGALSVTGGSAPVQASNFQSGIFHNASGLQTVTAASITVQGGPSGATNGAVIGFGGGTAPAGDQQINVSGSIAVNGAAGGNATIVAGPGRLQTINAGSISLTNALVGGNNSAGTIVAANQLINTTGDVTLTARGGNGSNTGARIGGATYNIAGVSTNVPTNLTMHVGGNLSLSGGSAPNNGSGIGSASSGTSEADNITISAGGSVILNSGTAAGTGARIGSSLFLPTVAGGNISITAAGDIQLNGGAAPAAIRTTGNVDLSAGNAITENANGLVLAHALSTTSHGDTSLIGPNRVASFSGTTTAGGNITLNNAGPLVIQAINAANAAVTNAGSVAIRGGVNTSGSLNLNVAGALSIEASGAQDATVNSSGGQAIQAQSLTLTASGDGRAANLVNFGGEQTIDIAGGSVDLVASGNSASAVISQNGTGNQRITVVGGDHVALAATGFASFTTISNSANSPSSFQEISITGVGANALVVGAGGGIFGPSQTLTAGLAGQVGSITVSGGALVQGSGTVGQTISTSGALTVSDSTLAGGGVFNDSFAVQRITADSLAVVNGSVGSNGGQDISAHSVSVLSTASASQIFNSNGNQTITVTGGNLDVLAPNALSQSIISNGSLSGLQSITVSGGDRINVNGAGFQSFAGIQSSSAQTISITGSGLNAIAVGSTGALGSSNISSGGAQSLTAGVTGTESGSISVTGGNTVGFSSSVLTIAGTSGDQTISTAGALSVTGGEASLQAQSRQSGIFLQGSGNQSVSAASIAIQGGASGAANGAFISASSGTGNQVVSVSGDLTLEGRAGGNATLIGSPVGQQNISAHDVSLTSGIGGTNSVAGIFAAHQMISASGDVTLTAQASTAAPGSLPGVRIGGATGSSTDVTLLVGNNLTLNGGPADNNGAGIGSSAVGTPLANNISISAGGSVTLNGGDGALSGARIGYSTLNGPAGGNITIGAGSIVLNGNASAAAIRTTGDVQLDAGSVREDSNGQIVAGNLRLRTIGNADLGGPNAVGNLSTVLQGPGGIPTPGMVGGFLKFNNTGDLAITSDVTSVGSMTLDVAGKLDVSALNPGQSAQVTANGGQTVHARSLSIQAQNGGNASLRNFGPTGQTIEIAGGGAGTGVEVRVLGTGGGTAQLINFSGAQTLTASGSDFVTVNAASGLAIINSQATQTVSITGGGANRINIGGAAASGVSQILARSQAVTAGSGSQAGGIDIVGTNALGATTGLITFSLPGNTQSISTSGALRVSGGSAVNTPLPIPPATTVPVSNAGIFNNSNGQQTISASSIELNGGLAGSGNAALISSTGGGVAANSGNQVINVGPGGIRMTGGTVGNSNRATIIASANQTIDSAGDIVMTGGASGGAVNFTNNAAILANRADSVQTIHAGNILLTSGAAGVENSSSITAPTQRIYATGDVTLQGGGSTGVLNGVRVGGLGGNIVSNTDLELNVGGNLMMNGGSVANNGASIGSTLFTGAPLTSRVIVTTGGDVIMNSGAGAGARIGTSVLSSSLAGGDVSITAGGSIQLNGGAQSAAIRTLGDVTLNAGATISEGVNNSFVLANLLTTTSAGDTSLGGANQVSAFSGISSGGSVTLNNAGPLVVQAINAANAALITATSVHGSGTISTGTGFTVSVAEDSELNGIIGGTGGLNKNGVGFLSLGAVNTYAGDTNVNAGTLALAAPDQTTAGNINIAGGATFRGSPGTYNNAGVIAGNGTLDVAATSFTNSGTLRPGGAGAIGTLTIQGNAALNGTLDIEAQSSANYDVLAVTGTATLGGSLNVTPINGYAPQGGDALVPLTFASRSGTLNITPTDWLSTYNPGNLTLGFSPLNRWIATTGNWDVASNWSLGHVPTNFETVLIDVPGSQFVTVSTGAQAAARLTSNENFVIAGGSLNLNRPSSFNGSLSLLAGELTGAGDVTVNGAFVWTGGRLSGAGSFLTTAATTSLLAPLFDDLVLGKSWTNQGTVNWINVLPRSITGTGSLQNQGTMNVLGSGATIETAFSNSGTLNLFTGLDLRQSSGNAGTINLEGTARLKVHGAYTNFGRLAGEGTVETNGGPLVNQGTVAPGGSGIGALHVQGDFQQGPTGVLEIDLGGTRVGQFDTLDVSGTATLGGTLFLRAANGYVPRDGDDFRLVTYRSRTGTFQFVLPPAGFTVDSDYAKKFASFELEQ